MEALGLCKEGGFILGSDVDEVVEGRGILGLSVICGALAFGGILIKLKEEIKPNKLKDASHKVYYVWVVW